MNKKLVLLDLDRTLFDSDNMIKILSDNLQPKDRPCLIEAINEYYVNPNDYKRRYIDYLRVAKDYGLSFEGLRQLVLHNIKQNSLIYPDAKDLIKWLAGRKSIELGVITFGQSEMQEVKMELSPMLIDLVKNIYYVMELKKDFIENNFPNIKGCLIDDKPGQNLPKGWVEINIDRKAKISSPLKIGYNVWKISRLNQVKQMEGL